MKLYIANGQYVGTQADARAINKQFDEAEVPVDKAGLIDYLNRYTPIGFLQSEDEFTTVVERQDQPMPSYADRTIAIDEVWEALPLARKLHFAAMAMEDARTALRRPATPPGELSTRASHLAQEHGLTKEDVREQGDRLLRIPNMGRKAVSELKSWANLLD